MCYTRHKFVSQIRHAFHSFAVPWNSKYTWTQLHGYFQKNVQATALNFHLVWNTCTLRYVWMWPYACLFGLMDLFCISFGSWSERPCVLQLLIKMLIRLCLMWEGLVLLYKNFHQGWRVVQRGDERPFSLTVLGSDTQLGIKPGPHWWGANTKHSLTRQTGLLAAVFFF